MATSEGHHGAEAFCPNVHLFRELGGVERNPL
jgi:hypothetical protein